MLLPLLILVQADDAAAVLAKTRTALSVDRRCIVRDDSTDITVCGLRNADRFRVPFIVHDAGDPRYQSVRVDRERLLHHTTPVQDMGPFLVGGGMAGVSAMIGGDGGVQTRKLAP